MISPGAGTPLLVPLVCPRCGKDLDAGPGDLVGLCIPCQEAHVLGRAGASFPLKYFRAGTGKAEVRFLPFWKVGASWEMRGTPVQMRAYARFPPAGDLLFPAFWRPALSYSTDLTWRLFALPQLPALESGEEPVPGGVRSPSVLPEMTRLSVLSYLDRVADVDGLDLRISVRSIAYVGYPFLEEAGGWVDGILGAHFPPTLFPGRGGTPVGP